MEYKKMLLFMIIISSFFLTVSSRSSTAQTRVGAVLVAHGSNVQDWNQRVLEFHGNCSEKIPLLQLAFLRFDKQRTLANAVNILHGQGITNILLIHLSPSSYSNRHRELQTIKDSGLPAFPSVQFALAPAMDNHHLIVDILKDYAHELLQDEDPANACLLLIGYGPVEDLENIVWLRQLESIERKICAEISFKDAECLTLRNHAPDLIREQAILDLKKTVNCLSEKGKVLIIPYVLCRGSFHEDLQSYLRGIALPETIVIGEKGVIDHDKAVEWVEDVFAAAMNQPAIKPVNRNWSAMDSELDNPIGTNPYPEYPITPNP